jgi:hypothetical protein
MSLITILRVHPGGGPACEELLGRLAEGIAKVGDPSRLHVYEAILGDTRAYWTARPMEGMRALDEVLPPRDLLVKAFGEKRGGKIYREGVAGLEHVDRQLTMLRLDLSHP